MLTYVQWLSTNKKWNGEEGGEEGIIKKTEAEERFFHRSGFLWLDVLSACGYCECFKSKGKCNKCPLFKARVCGDDLTTFLGRVFSRVFLGGRVVFWEYVDEMRKTNPDFVKALRLAKEIGDFITKDGRSKGFC